MQLLLCMSCYVCTMTHAPNTKQPGNKLLSD